jgi:dolichol-phosphate mannosyltransferase
LEREKGESKIAGIEAMRSLKVIFTLRYREWEKLFKVAIIGAIGAVFQYLVFNLLRLRMEPHYAIAISVEVAIVSNFLLNNVWTFRDNRFTFEDAKIIISKFVQFNVFSLGSFTVQTLLMKFGVQAFGRGFFIENGLMAVGILLGLIINYLVYTKIIWRKS